MAGSSVTVIGLPQALAKVAQLVGAAIVGSERGETVLSEGVAERARQKVAILTGETQASIEVTGEGVEAENPYLEFGTSFMPAQPFMRPAADEAGSDLPEVIHTLQAAITGVL